MVIKISNQSQNEGKKFLGIFKPSVLPNGNHVYFFTQGDQLGCEIREEKYSRFMGDLELHLGELSYLKKEVIKIFKNLMYETELPNFLILTYIRDEIFHKLKRKGKKRKEIIKIREKLFDTLNLHEYIVEIFPSNKCIRSLFAIGPRVRKLKN